MHAEFILALESRAAELKASWVALLRIEPITTPLAHPDGLVHLLDDTVNRFFATLRRNQVGSAPTEGHALQCSCGRNPLLAYFSAGRQAVNETLINTQTAAAPVSPDRREAERREAESALLQIAHREIENFCSLCQFRSQPATSTTSRSHASAGATD